MRTTLTFGLLLVALCLGAGCQSRSVWLANGVRYALQPPSALNTELTAVQKVSASYRDQQFRFLTQVEITPTQFILAGLGEGGLRAFLLRDDGVTLDYQQHPLFKAPIRPAYLVADFQAIYWPSAALITGLRGGELVESPGQREIRRHGQPVIRIRYEGPNPWNNTVIYTHLHRGYTLTLRSQVQE
jgi:hypothetical protein